MARTIRADHGYEYAYVPGEQPANLLYLAAVSGAGTAIIVPQFIALLEGTDQPTAFPCVPLGRDLMSRGKASPNGELGALLRALHDEFLRIRDPHHASLEFVQSAMAENIVEILERIDAQSERALLDLMLVGTVGYLLPKSDWPRMLLFVNESLPRPRKLDLAVLATKPDSAAAEDTRNKQRQLLRGKVDYLPFLGLSLLEHAIQNDRDALIAHEDEPELFAEGFWELVREWHGWRNDAPPTVEPRARFTRALVAHFAGRNPEARRILNLCKASGDTRADRYLAAPRR